MKRLSGRFSVLLLAFALSPALAQPGHGRHNQQPGHHAQRQMQRSMPPAERRMSWEDRERLREQVRSGQMTREQAREHRREERARRAGEGFTPEQRDQLRRDVLEANRDLPRR